MNKKTIERMATIALVAFLVGMFIFQVAYASNESDYKYGFKSGAEAYRQCSSQSMQACTASENLYGLECEPGDPIGPNFLHVHIYNVDNKTACNHGYFHGWIHECLKDDGGALCVYQPGHIIIAGRTGPGYCYNTTKEGETCESGPMIPIGHH